ncbi:MAG: hypothetical protein NWE98_03040 [Candidatus Bathyarchaeota archaeon]|nr:hypothetical protein [Candidatus Bathyarchaeota archaeon]
MEKNVKTTTVLLLVLEGVGAAFVGVFLAAYLGGMLMTPSTTVLHSEPAFSVTLTILGAALLILMLATIILAFNTKLAKKPS